MSSPLFPNFNRFTRQQQEAIRRWMAANGKGGSTGSANAPRSSQPTRYGRNSGPSQNQSQNQSNNQSNWLWKSLLSKLGPLGQIVDAMLRPQGQSIAPDFQKELDAAQKLLESFGYAIGQPGQSAGSHPLIRELVDESNAAEQQTRTAPAQPPGPPRRRSTTSPAPAADEPDQNQNDLPDGVHQTQSGTLIEGMIPVSSSNVHSIGYEWNPDDARRPGNLLVRFLGGTGKNRSGKGALYRYFDVPRAIFTAFKMAASKGKFVWDDLRVRGSVSGHQYAYELAGTDEAGYIPRQAGLKRGQQGEFYMPRNFAGRRSTLPERQVRGVRGELVKDFKANAKKVKLRAGRRS